MLLFSNTYTSLLMIPAKNISNHYLIITQPSTMFRSLIVYFIDEFQKIIESMKSYSVRYDHYGTILFDIFVSWASATDVRVCYVYFL